MDVSRWFAAALGLLLLAGCSRSAPDPDAGGNRAPTAPSAQAGESSDAAMDATWQGVLPCADCDGIQTRLRLVADDQGRRFELQESYLSGDGAELFEGQGEWAEENSVIDGESSVVYRLDINGASRWYSLKPDGALEMLDADKRASAEGLAHRLQRM